MNKVKPAKMLKDPESQNVLVWLNGTECVFVEDDRNAPIRLSFKQASTLHKWISATLAQIGLCPLRARKRGRCGGHAP